MKRFLPLLCIAAASVFFFLQFLHWNLEDGYIVYRIVRNILAGQGWAYNVGQNYNPSTSILNPILLTGASLFFSDISTAAHALCGVYLFTVGFCLFSLLKKDLGLLLATITALLGMHTLAWAATWGLETMLVCALLLIAAVREQSGKPAWIIYGLAILARPDAAILVIIRLAYECFHRRELPIRAALLVAAPVLPWAIFSLHTFGEIFPATLRNKMWQGRSGFWGEGFVYWQGLKQHLGQAIWGIVPRTILVILGLFGAVLLALRRNPLFLFVLFAILTQIAYVVLNVPAYHWYFALFDLAMIVSAAWLLLFMPALILKDRVDIRLSYIALLLLSLVIGWKIFTWRSSTVWASGNEHYLAASDAINAANAPTGSLAAVEVGTLGFFVPREIFDFIGLTSSNAEVLTGAHIDQFFANNPAVVVLHEPPWGMEYAVASDARFQVMYGDGFSVATPHTPLKFFVRKQSMPPTRAEAEQQIAAFFPTVTKVEKLSPTNATSVCVIDTINGAVWQGASPMQAAAAVMRISGWAELPDQSLKLVFKDHRATFVIPATRTARPDAAAHLNIPEHPNVGYKTEFLRSSLPAGKYAVSLRIARPAGQVGEFLCAPRLVLEVP